LNAGAAFNSEKNLTFVIRCWFRNNNCVEFFHGADDGVEFFGGTVNTNLISIGNEDDQFDWTEDGLELTQTGMGIRFRKRKQRYQSRTFELGYLNTPITLLLLT
jgi:hypothetical protein